MLGIDQTQFARTDGIYVCETGRSTTGGVGFVVVRLVVVGAPNWIDCQWQVEAVHQAHIVEVLTSVTIHGEFSQCVWKKPFHTDVAITW